jgi:hypothetical protein
MELPKTTHINVALSLDKLSVNTRKLLEAQEKIKAQEKPNHEPRKNT